MTEAFVGLLRSFPPELASLLLASLPVTELRAALPVALFVFGLDAPSAYIWTVLGNLIPLILVYALLPSLLAFALRFAPGLNHRLEAYFEKLKARHGEAYSKWGAFFLFLFVAVPLPGTGVWTGSVLAILFRIKPTLAVPFILAGLLVAGLLVLAIAQGVFAGITLL